MDMNQDHWNPDQYSKFKDERSRPFWDLAKRIRFDDIDTMLDVGCGTGELTHALHVAHQLTKTTGIDSSERMLEESKRFSTRGLNYELADIELYSPPQQYDLVLSNAALQWLPDHKILFPKLIRWLTPGGTLAVQMPLNFEHVSHKIAEEVAPQFGLKPRQIPMLKPEEYAQTLWDNGLIRIDVSMKVYLHPLPSAKEVVEWTKGTLLTYYQNQLPPKRYDEFIRQYSADLLRHTGEGKYLYTFKRLFLVAHKT
jgi:trans-aconitate 2-methyltransferase